MAEKKEVLEEIFKETLTNINKNLLLFFKFHRKEFKTNENLSEIFYTHQIFRNRKKLILLADIIRETEKHFKDKIKENKKKTEMYNKRLNEMSEVKNFVEENKQLLLNQNNNRFLLENVIVVK